MPLQQGVGAGRFPAKDVKLSGVLVHSRYDRERARPYAVDRSRLAARPAA